MPSAYVKSYVSSIRGCFGFRQAQLAGDQTGEQGVAEGGEDLGLCLIREDLGTQVRSKVVEGGKHR